MNIQRFTAPTSREAMAKARRMFGESAVILSSRATDEGFEVMAAAEESIAQVTVQAQSATHGERITPIRTRPTGFQNSQPAGLAGDSVDSDTQALSMSTLSFQEYVRERMLRKRKASLSGDSQPAPETPRPVAAAEPIRVMAPAPRPVASPMVAPVLAQPAQPPATMPLHPVVPPPILTRQVMPMADEEAPRAVASERVHEEISALKEMIEERFNTMAWLGAAKQNPVQSQLMLKLIRAGYSPSMSRAVLERVPADSPTVEAQRWVTDVITRNLKAAAPSATLCDEGGVIALIGATGVGKTTTAAKLAAQCVKQYGAGSVGLVTLDTYRVSGYEQLRAYGRMLGVVAHLAHDRAALIDLLNLLSSKRMVIIDTAGLGQRDERIQDMLDLLDLPKVKKCLVLNAGAHGDTLDDVLTAFKASTLHGVVLSKVDEAVKLGPAIDAMVRHQVVLRGVANGQRVPEDWQNADAAALVRMSLGTEGKSAFDPLSTEMGFYYSQASSRGIQLGASHV